MKKKYFLRSELIFIFAITLYMVAKTIELSTIFYEVPAMPSIMKILRYLSYLIVFVKLLYDSKYTENEIIKILFIIVLLGVISIHVGNNILFCSFFFIIAARNMSINQLIKIIFWIQVILTISMAVLSQLGFVSDWTYHLEGRNRHSLGYLYPSYISSIFFYVILAYLLIRRNRLKLVEVVIIEFLNGIIFYLTDSKTSFFLTAIILIVFWFVKFYKKELKKNFYSIILYVVSIPVIAIVSIITCFLYSEENKVLLFINSFINNRLIMGHNALFDHGLSLFGEQIQWIGYGGLGYLNSSLQGEYNYVDCSYVKVLLDYGIIFFVLMIFGYALVSVRAINNKDRYLCLCIIFMCAYSIIEPRIIEFGFNPFVLTLSALFGKNMREEDELEKFGECNYS